MSQTLSCIIVDDEPLAIRLLENHIGQIPELVLLKSFNQPTEAVQFLRTQQVDLLLLDIHMPGLTGLEVAEILSPRPAIIFTTAYREYAVESYELEVVDYLLKPIPFARFYKSIHRFLKMKKADPAPSDLANNPTSAALEGRFFSVNKRQVRVQYANIIFVESQKDYVRIVTTNGEISTKSKISELITVLPDYFVQAHRSYLINLQAVTAYSAHDIELGDYTIPIGQSHKLSVMRRLEDLKT
ncbi:MAG: response regulator transcription factor [Bacteroidota bacterium]